MKKENIVFWLSIIAIAISIVAIVSVHNNINGSGFIIGILSILTTVLIGWNIYSIVDLNRIRHEQKETLDDLQKFKQRLSKKSESIESQMRYEWNMDILEMVPILTDISSEKDWDKTLKSCFDTYGKASSSKIGTAKRIAFKYIEKTAYILYKEYNHGAETIHHLIKDLYGKVCLEDVQKMWNDAVLHKYPDDISSHTDQQQTMLFFLSKLIDGLYQQGQADHHQE